MDVPPGDTKEMRRGVLSRLLLSMRELMSLVRAGILPGDRRRRTAERSGARAPGEEGLPGAQFAQEKVARLERARAHDGDRDLRIWS